MPNLASLGAGAGIFLLLDRFATNASAPLTSPRNCEPGPGTLVIADAGNKLSISSNALQLAATTAFAATARGPGLRRVCGLALLWTGTPGGTAPLVGFSNNTTLSDANTKYAAQFNTGTDLFFRESATSAATALEVFVSGARSLALILRSSGVLLICDGNLEWVSVTGSDATMYPIVAQLSTTGTLTLDDLRAVQLGGAFASDYGLATNRIAVTANGDTTTQTADGIVEHTITAATGVTQELMVRRVDDSNCWIVRMDQAGSTIKLIEKNAGVETERSSAAQTWTNGTAFRVSVRLTGQKIYTYVGTNTQKNAYTSASFQQTSTGVKVSHAGTNLVAWPRAVTLPSV